MARSIKLDLRRAKELLVRVDRNASPGVFRDVDALKSAIRAAESTKRASSNREKRKAKDVERLTKGEETADIRAKVFARAGDACEACGTHFAAIPGEFDHFFGRARAESLETCWALCRVCHREKTLNKPNAARWLEWFIAHARKHDYRQAVSRATNRLHFVQARGGGR